jgi:hypothetical protein
MMDAICLYVANDTSSSASTISSSWFSTSSGSAWQRVLAAGLAGARARQAFGCCRSAWTGQSPLLMPAARMWLICHGPRAPAVQLAAAGRGASAGEQVISRVCAPAALMCPTAYL